MTEGAFFEPRKSSPTALTVVVLLHGAAIGALAIAKMDVEKRVFTDTEIIEVALPPPPPPPVEAPKVKTEPQHRSRVDMPTPLVPLPAPPVYFDPRPVPPQPFPGPTPVGETEVPPAPPPPPPPPPPARTVEPARAKANLASYVSDEDYPASAARNEEQGATRFRLEVGANGRVTNCTVTGSSGSSALDSATCRIMRSRARFSPARDSAGNPTGDTVNSTIRWVLPED